MLWSNPVNGLTELAVVLGDVEEGPSQGGRPTLASRPAVGLSTAGPSGGEGLGSGRRVYLLALHRPGPVDQRHLSQVAARAGREAREAEEAARASQAQQRALEDQFAVRAPWVEGRQAGCEHTLGATHLFPHL